LNRIITIFVVLCFLPFIAFSQFEPTEEECSLLTRTMTDDYKMLKRHISKQEIRVNDLSSGDLFQLVMTRTEDTFSFIIRGVNKHCFDNNTEVTFFFRNGSSIVFTSQNRDNCESLVLVNMASLYKNKDQYDTFLNQYIIGIMFESSTGDQHRLKIETPQTEMVQEVFECLVVAQ